MPVCVWVLEVSLYLSLYECAYVGLVRLHYMFLLWTSHSLTAWHQAFAYNQTTVMYIDSTQTIVERSERMHICSVWEFKVAHCRHNFLQSLKVWAQTPVDVPAFGCVHAYVLLSVCVAKKVLESAGIHCSKMCLFLSFFHWNVLACFCMSYIWSQWLL